VCSSSKTELCDSASSDVFISEIEEIKGVVVKVKALINIVFGFASETVT